MNKIIYWSFKAVLGITGIIVLYLIIPSLTKLLNLLVELFNLTNTTPEFKIILVCIAIYVTCKVIDTILNLIFKLNSLLKEIDGEE